MKLQSDLKILGIIGGAHSCGLAYFDHGELVCVLEEERLVRIKPYVDFEQDFCRFPTQSLNCLINDYNVDLQYVDYFTSFLGYHECIAIFKDCLGFDLPLEKFIKVDHHHSHCAASYFFSGFKEDTLVFCADASGGNGYSSKTYIGSNGRLNYVGGIPLTRKSLGHFYASLTEILGFKRLKDEGKVVGLSGHGFIWHDLYNAWNEVINIENVQTDFDLHNIESGGVHSLLHSKFFDLVGSKFWRADNTIKNMAATGQYLFEQKLLELLNNIHEKRPDIRKLALSGGIFANVKLNKRINELDWVDEMFVLPPMGDEGLALGAALIVLNKFEPIKPFRLENVYFGNEYSEQQIDVAAEGFTKMPLDLEFISGLLLDKKILGLYQGRSEHGARALGNRSIICDCTHEETYNILNGKLQRNDFMPFAPAVLDEDADIIFNVGKSAYTAEFMTCLFDTREEFRDKIPTVVHPVDKTARIQIVTEKGNALFYNILKNYKSHSGLGILVNTSFNVHNEPIVETPENAFAHLRSGVIDYLVTPNAIYTNLGYQ